jgi:hypothetical protein
MANGLKSSLEPIATGVPQGSTLGPLLFLIFIYEMVKELYCCKNLLFADDALLYVSGTDKTLLEAQMQHDLNLLSEWCSRNHLTINIDKTKFMVFSPARNRNKYQQISLNIGGSPIQEVVSYKYLGTLLDNNMTGIPQYNRVVSQMAEKLCTFSKIR